jgi:hypothetical protein
MRLKLGVYRETVNYWKLVLRGPDGLIRKVAALPKPKSESERIAERAAEQRQEREAAWARQDHSNPMRIQTERFIREIVGDRIAVLEETVSDLQAQIEEMQSQQVAA